MVKIIKSLNFLKKFLLNRKGTAEVIGSILFVIIVMFFFSSVYLWHDNATKTMNNLLSDKLNSEIQVSWLIDENGNEQNILVVTNTGGVGTTLSRLWIVTSTNGAHRYANFENLGLYIGAGNTMTIELRSPTSANNPIPATPSGTGAVVSYARTKVDGETFTVLTTLGNMASPEGLIKIVAPIDYGSATVGSVIVADYNTFYYYKPTGNTLGAPLNGYNINSQGANIAFSLTLTNNDYQQRTITLDSNSQMFFIGVKNNNLMTYIKIYIVDVQNGVIQNTYSSKTLQYGQSTTIYFASDLPSTYDAFVIDNQIKPGSYPLNLALIGTFTGGVPFGQNIPFVTTYITS